MTSASGPTRHEREPIDLDRLIGDLETEGARRRAAPDYPHEQDAEIHFELERRAPSAAQQDELRELIGRVQELASAALDAASGREDTPRATRRALVRRVERLEERVRLDMAALAASLAAVGEHLQHVERHLAVPGDTEAGGDDTAPPHAGGEARRGAPDAGGPALSEWRDRLVDTVAVDAGRVLYGDVDTDVVVGALRAAGLDAYGIDGTGTRLRAGPDVRNASVVDHLRAVGDNALGAAVLAGAPDAMTPGVLDALVAELHRTAATAVVVSEAPWSWRRRVGPVAADRAANQPFECDTWLEAFHRLGRPATAEYSAQGHSYRLVARRPS